MSALDALPWIRDEELAGALALAATLEVHGHMHPADARQLWKAIYRRLSARPKLAAILQFSPTDDDETESLIEFARFDLS